jgi:hypothetical protein
MLNMIADILRRMNMEQYKDKLAEIVKTFNEDVEMATQKWTEDIAKAGTVHTAAVADAGAKALAQIQKLMKVKG